MTLESRRAELIQEGMNPEAAARKAKWDVRFANLVKAKRQAGLDQAQAESVARQQITEDKAREEKAGENAA